MTAVDDDMPRRSGSPTGATAEPGGAGAGRRRNEILSDDELRDRHRDRPAVGDLVIDVRRYILSVDPTYPFAEFARQMRKELPDTFSKCLSRDLSRKVSNQASKEPSGFSLDVVEAVLSLLVPEREQELKARHWADLWELDGRKRPEFRISTPYRGGQATEDAPDDASTETSVEDLAERDRVIAEQRAQLLINTRTITELIESRDRLRASTKRYEVLATQPPVTIDDIDATVQMLCAALGAPNYIRYLDGEDDTETDPPRLPLEEDVVRTVTTWREGGVSPSHWTTEISSRRTLKIISTILVIIMVLGLAGQVILGH